MIKTSYLVGCGENGETEVRQVQLVRVVIRDPILVRVGLLEDAHDIDLPACQVQLECSSNPSHRRSRKTRQKSKSERTTEQTSDRRAGG
eukprot:2779866-Rhodomonas_salina.3